MERWASSVSWNQAWSQNIKWIFGDQLIIKCGILQKIWKSYIWSYWHSWLLSMSRLLERNIQCRLHDYSTVQKKSVSWIPLSFVLWFIGVFPLNSHFYSQINVEFTCCFSCLRINRESRKGFRRTSEASWS